MPRLKWLVTSLSLWRPWVWYWASPCEICGGQNGPWAVIFLSTQIFACQYQSTTLHTNLYSVTTLIKTTTRRSLETFTQSNALWNIREQWSEKYFPIVFWSPKGSSKTHNVASYLLDGFLKSLITWIYCIKWDEKMIMDSWVGGVMEEVVVACFRVESQHSPWQRGKLKNFRKSCSQPTSEVDASQHIECHHFINRPF